MNIHHLELQPTAPSLSSAAGGHFEADQSPHSLSYRLPSDDDEPHPADFEDHSDDGGESVSSLVDEDVNFNYVYALFEFPAMVEGQLTVYQGERMVLLQDDNPYWWLVHLPRTREIGYIPADNVETAPEKLARVNRRKNLQLCKPSSTEGASDLDLLIAAQNPNNPLPPRGLPPHNAAATEPPTKKSNQNGASVRFHEYLVTAAFDAYSYSGSDYEDSDNDDSYIPGYIADGDQHHGEDDDE
ncbi:protein phosphatase regulator, partial [Spiromyces aspiralis]